jgi:RNA polymerase subunit RPABC4/transcription elongation factor Spt4
VPIYHNPRSFTLSAALYRALLRVYPRRFRAVYLDDMSQVFRDCCREAFREKGRVGVVHVWGLALLDLGKSAPKEHVTQSLDGSQKPAMTSRSCSGCYSEVEPDWRKCPICGTVLNEGTTHVTHRQPPDQPGYYALELGRAAARRL